MHKRIAEIKKKSNAFEYLLLIGTVLFIIAVLYVVKGNPSINPQSSPTPTPESTKKVVACVIDGFALHVELAEGEVGYISSHGGSISPVHVPIDYTCPLLNTKEVKQVTELGNVEQLMLVCQSDGNFSMKFLIQAAYWNIPSPSSVHLTKEMANKAIVDSEGYYREYGTCYADFYLMDAAIDLKNIRKICANGCNEGYSQINREIYSVFFIQSMVDIPYELVADKIDIGVYHLPDYNFIGNIPEPTIDRFVK